jgi:hypothetical protein
MMGAKAVVAPIEKGPQIAQPNARRDESLLGSQAVETTIIEQKPSLEPGREKVDVVAGRLTLNQQLEAVTSTSGRSSASELLRPEPRSTAREAGSDLDPKVAMATERLRRRALPPARSWMNKGCLIEDAKERIETLK